MVMAVPLDVAFTVYVYTILKRLVNANAEGLCSLQLAYGRLPENTFFQIDTAWCKFIIDVYSSVGLNCQPDLLKLVKY